MLNFIRPSLVVARSRQITLVAVATLCTLTGVLALTSAPALAIDTHFFSSSFGAAGSTSANPYPLSDPTGVAVAANGDVYVTDTANAWVEKFDSSGHLLLIFGEEVNKTAVLASGSKAEKDVCAVASKDTCQPGTHASIPGAFEAPSFIAVDDSTDLSQGDVYVADTGDDLVSKFTSEGGLIESWESEGQLSESLVPEGSRGSPPGIGGVAVDPIGNLWVAYGTRELGGTGHSFDEFGENGLFTQLSQGPHDVERSGIAVNAADDLYVHLQYSGLVLYGQSGGGQFEDTSASSGLALDSSDEGLYVDEGGSLIQHYADGCLAGCGVVDSFGVNELSGAGGLAVDPVTHDVYAADTGAGRIDVFIPAVLPTVTTGSASEVGISTATVAGSVTPAGSAVSKCEFQYGETESYGQSVPCEPGVNKITGTGLVAVKASLVGLKPNHTVYHFRLVSANAQGTEYGGDQSFATPARPSVTGESFSNVEAHKATAVAQVNPEGLSTTYDVEYGTSEAYGLATPVTSIGAGTEVVDVSAALGGSLESLLEPETTYHFRVVAENADGTSRGPDMTFTTYPEFSGLPDGRGYEMVSPLTNANGNVYEPGLGRIGTAGGLQSPLPMRASANGDAVEYAADPQATGGSGDLGTFGGGNEYVARRNSEGGWSATDLETPGLEKVPYEALFSSELSNSGTSAVPAGSHNLSAGGEGVFDSVGGRKILVSVLPSTHPGEQGAPVAQAGLPGSLSHVMSADGSRIFWVDGELGPDQGRIYVREDGDVTVPVSTGSATFWTASSNGEYAFYTENESFYRFDVQTGERLALAAGAHATGTGNLSAATGTGRITAEGTKTHIISDVHATSGAFAVGQTIEAGGIDGCHGGLRGYTIKAIPSPTELEIVVPGAGEGEPLILACPVELTATSDEVTSVTDATGTFRAGELIHGAGIAPGTRIGGVTASTLVLSQGVTAQGNGVAISSGGPDVQGVLGTNEGGEAGAYVYFVARGVLASNKREYEGLNSAKLVDEAREEDYNLYVYHAGAIMFIAQNVEAASGLAFSERSAEVARDGRSVVFMSGANLTGYDSNGESEMYVYDADTGRLSCASCNPTGGPPNAAAQVSPPAVFEGAFMHRWISENGSRVFFDTGEGLVSQDTNGKEDVYEWERPGTGSCTAGLLVNAGCVYLLSGGTSPSNSSLLDTSTSGNDVFIVTRAQLAPEDGNENLDVYDVRVGAREPLAKQACSGTGCQGLPSAPPPFATPSSVTFNGVGNFPSSAPAVVKSTKKTVKCAKAKKLRHGKCVRVKKSKKAKRATNDRGSNK